MMKLLAFAAAILAAAGLSSDSPADPVTVQALAVHGDGTAVEVELVVDWDAAVVLGKSGTWRVLVGEVE